LRNGCATVAASDWRGP